MQHIDLNDLATNPESKNVPPPKSDLEGLNNPARWPHRPLMPVIRRKKAMPGLYSIGDAGVVMEGEPGTVYLVNLFNYLGVGQRKLKELLGDAKTEVYDSWEAMLADGWKCD